MYKISLSDIGDKLHEWMFLKGLKSSQLNINTLRNTSVSFIYTFTKLIL